MILNPFGKIVAEEWIKTPVVRPTIELSEYVIMPNHIHGIIIIRSDNTVGATRRVAPTTTRRVTPTTTRRVTPTTTRRVARPQTIPNGPTSGSIGAIIGQIKSLTTKRINAIRDTPGISVWQRNYYEHIIRSETELNRICAYITANPINWEKDRENQA